MKITLKYFSVSIRCFLMMALSSISLLPAVVVAQTMNKNDADSFSTSNPWFVTGELGYANYSNMYLRDGQTPLGRFSIGRDLGKANIFNFALEAGIQNGNTMRYPIDEQHQDHFGTTYQVVAKPIMDLLLTVKTNPLNDRVPVFALFKVGPALQRWSFTGQDIIRDETKVSLEAQAGLGYWINKRTTIQISYQRIFGASPELHVNEGGETGYISNIPTQQAVLFGISTRF